MKVKGRTLGAWFNRKRFNQRKAKGYTLSKRFDHRLSRLLSWLLFKLLPPRWYLRLHGFKVRREHVVVTVTYHRQDTWLLVDKRQAQVRFNDAEAIIKMLPLWFRHGFCEPVPELSPYIPRHLDDKRYYIPPENILKVEWYDPVLKDHISVDGPIIDWSPDGNYSDDQSANRVSHN